MDNLINIKCLDSENIIEQLGIRYKDDIIYTKIDNILIAVNPFKKIDKNNDRPHPDFIAETMMNGMINHQLNQSVLISGESGAGKTETTKILLNKLLDKESSSLGKMILASNIILESFGNAATIRNHNSSRFGKLITLLYDSNYQITGAEVKTYLLEKIRVTDKDIIEKNFHVFYLLNNCSKNSIVCTSSTSEKNFDGDDTLDKLLNAFKIFGLEDYIDDIKNILKIIILLTKYDENMDELSKLFGIRKDKLLIFLEKQMITIGNETIYKDLTEEVIEVKIKTLSQELYNNLFNFVVKNINKKLQPKIKSDSYLKINLLDIFGFEILNRNSIEQLCINYTNEILQNQFNKYFFEKEQQLYLSEGLPYNLVNFKNNDDIIFCIEKKIFGVVNEVTKFIKAKDIMIVDKFHGIQKDTPYLSVSSLDRGKGRFQVKHYANTVKYHAKNFIRKNNLNLSNDIINLTNNCSNRLISLFKIKSSKNLLLNNFQKQIKQLQKVINSTEVNFIRCLKPNDKNVPNNLDNDKVELQLKYNGIIEAIAIVRQGYPIRYNNNEFDDVFKIIPDKYKINIIRGKTLTFLKAEEEIELLEVKEKILKEKAMLIQKNFLAHYYSRKYYNIYQKIIVLQKYGRKLIARIKFKRVITTIFIQSIFRRFLARKKYRYLKNVVKIQSYVRRNIAMKKFIYFKAIVTIQKNYRAYLIRKQYKYIYNKLIIIQKFIRSKISLKQALENSMKKKNNNAANTIIRVFKYNRFCKLRNKIVIIGREYLIKRINREEMEKEQTRIREIERLNMMNNIRLMQEEDYIARRIRTEEKNKMIEELNQQNINNSLLINTLNNERNENKNMIQHLNKENEELLQAIAQKDIMLLQKIAHLEENLYHMNERRENKCTIM